MARLPCVFSVLLLVACGESTVPTDGGGLDAGTMGSDSGETDGAVDGGGGDDASVGCASAMEGAACSTERMSCGGPCTDRCAACTILRCTDFVWERFEAFPAPCFDCGPGQQCVAFEQYCVHSFSDVGGEPDTFECAEIPTACRADATCVCFEMALAFDECVEESPGEIEIRYFGG